MLAYSAIACIGTVQFVTMYFIYFMHCIFVMIIVLVHELIVILVGVSPYGREIGSLARPLNEYASYKHGCYVY